MSPYVVLGSRSDDTVSTAPGATFVHLASSGVGSVICVCPAWHPTQLASDPDGAKFMPVTWAAPVGLGPPVCGTMYAGAGDRTCSNSGTLAGASFTSTAPSGRMICSFSRTGQRSEEHTSELQSRV